MALIANCNGGRDGKPFTPSDFDQTMPRKPPAKLPKMPATILYDAFVKPFESLRSANARGPFERRR
jgi:hypothetical protein